MKQNTDDKNYTIEQLYMKELELVHLLVDCLTQEAEAVKEGIASGAFDDLSAKDRDLLRAWLIKAVEVMTKVIANRPAPVATTQEFDNSFFEQYEEKRKKVEHLLAERYYGQTCK